VGVTDFPSLLILGGARSGKSRYAQMRAEALPGECVFIATAQAFDDEMADRIRRHRDDRGERWRTVEAPFELADTIVAEAVPGRVLLIDCLTLWASNILLAERDGEDAAARLVGAIRTAKAPTILVANEVGLGIVPDNALARRFRDLAGTINQRIAADVSEVQFVAAGLPIRLK
jgi:adenosylcobinamide kinase / adenosylcobinamide-phosphate guanylyltransferase